MGCDIHTFVEVRKCRAWELLDVSIWDFRNYRVFGILADVRNYSAIPPISKPRGWPDDSSIPDQELWENDCCHSHSYYLLDELLNFDWDRPTEDRRCDVEIRPGVIDSGATCEPGKEVATTYREMMSPQFFEDLKTLKAMVDDPRDLRILFCFDS